MSQKKALITGVAGQDGSYLVEFLNAKGYEVHGLVRPGNAIHPDRDAARENGQKTNLAHYFPQPGDMTDEVSLSRILAAVQPHEIYHLAAQTHVGKSFDQPEQTMNVNAVGTIHLLEAVRKLGINTRFCQASTSEMFGLARESPQTETTPFHPRSPYAVSKVAAYWSTVNYRESYAMHASNAILFNHESPRRREEFVTRKITRAVANISVGLQKKLSLGNLDGKRDWGYAQEYVEALWLMLRQDQPDDYIIATGESHSVREFIQVAFDHVGLDWEKYVEYDARYVRPAEGALLAGNSAKAKKNLNWQPRTTFNDLVKLMVDSDLALVKAQASDALQTVP